MSRYNKELDEILGQMPNYVMEYLELSDEIKQEWRKGSKASDFGGIHHLWQPIGLGFRLLLDEVGLKARNDSLLDLERWIKLHDLGQEMILDGIEHMVRSNVSVLGQPRLDNSARLAQLSTKEVK